MKNIFKITGIICLTAVIAACGDCPTEAIVTPPATVATTTVTPEKPVVVPLPAVQPPNTVLCDLTTYIPCQTPTYIPAPVSVCNYETYIPCAVAPPICKENEVRVLGICQPVPPVVNVICNYETYNPCAAIPPVCDSNHILVQGICESVTPSLGRVHG